MVTSGLIVAGGYGTRMRLSGSKVPKPLVCIRGVSLLERNMLSLIKADIKDIHVAVSARRDGVGDFARSRCARVAKALNSKLSIIEEPDPLGSIGAAAFLRDRDEVVVVNADNLTTLDIGAFVTTHRERESVLTLAVHNQSIPIPFGKVTAEDGELTAYDEKPNLVIPICSAISALDQEALEQMKPGETLGLPVFANRLLNKGVRVGTFWHDAPWVDVNDTSAIGDAERLVSKHPTELEVWARQPDAESLAVIIHSADSILIEQKSDGTWSLPKIDIGFNRMSTSPVFEFLVTRYGIDESPQLISVFDHVDVDKSTVTRTHVIAASGSGVKSGNRRRWIKREDIGTMDDLSALATRACAIFMVDRA